MCAGKEQGAGGGAVKSIAWSRSPPAKWSAALIAASVLASLLAMSEGRLTGYVPRKEGREDVEAGDARWDPARDDLVGEIIVVVEQRVRRARRARGTGAHVQSTQS